MPSRQLNSQTVSLALLAAGALAVVYSLVRFWGANPEYLDRFLILAGAAYATSHSWLVVRHLPHQPARVGYFPLLVGGVAFPAGWFLQAQVGTMPVVLWWLVTAWVLAVVGVILLAGGWSQLRHLAFPLAFVFFALPMPHRILGPLQFLLQSATTTAAAWVLPLLGVSVERSGFILSLPGGDLGVAEACSGVRSVTALTAIAAFVAWWWGFGLVRGLTLVALSIPVIAAVNAVRVVASGLIQEHVGLDYVRGNWHEIFGILMVLLGLTLISGLAHLMSPRLNMTKLDQPDLQNHEAELPRHVPPRAACLVLICSALGTVASHFLGVNAEQEVVASAPIEQIPHQIGRWNGTDLAVPSDVAEMLTPDAITRRVYSDLGYDVHVWVIFWSSQNMVKGYHHPDVCWPNRGFRLTRRDTTEAQLSRGKIPMTVREFARGSTGSGRESDRQLILYWTQQGRRIWTEEDERQAQSLGSHLWLGDRLTRRELTTQTGRFVVLLGTPLWGDGTAIRKQTLELAGHIAEELYRVAPWADSTVP